MPVSETKFEPATVNVRTKISALWVSMLFVFAYVDLFTLYRADFRANLEAGEVGGFSVNQSFLLGTTAYVIIPSLMVFCTLVLTHGPGQSRHHPPPGPAERAATPDSTQLE
jgi:Family of unknown function (DUF6326)